MNYDELVDAINHQIVIAPPFALGGYTKFLQALSSVVTLCDFLDKKGRCCVPVKEVIDAIEKELGNG